LFELTGFGAKSNQQQLYNINDESNKRSDFLVVEIFYYFLIGLAKRKQNEEFRSMKTQNHNREYVAALNTNSPRYNKVDSNVESEFYHPLLTRNPSLKFNSNPKIVNLNNNDFKPIPILNSRNQPNVLLSNNNNNNDNIQDIIFVSSSCKLRVVNTNEIHEKLVDNGMFVNQLQPQQLVNYRILKNNHQQQLQICEQKLNLSVPSNDSFCNGKNNVSTSTTPKSKIKFNDKRDFEENVLKMINNGSFKAGENSKSNSNNNCFQTDSKTNSNDHFSQFFPSSPHLKQSYT
jgi:hypothetical protein